MSLLRAIVVFEAQNKCTHTAFAAKVVTSTVMSLPSRLFIATINTELSIVNHSSQHSSTELLATHLFYTSIHAKMQTMALMNTSSLQQRIASPIVKPTAVRPAPLRLRSVVVRAEAPKDIQVCDPRARSSPGPIPASCGAGVRHLSDKVSWPSDNLSHSKQLATSSCHPADLCSMIAISTAIDYSVSTWLVALRAVCS